MKKRLTQKYFKTYILGTILTALTLTGCQSSPTPKVSNSNLTYPMEYRHKGDMTQKQGVYYELFVRAFADSNGDGIGDFNGLTNQLDYLQDLGIDGIWLMPINASPSYHGYDVMDYEKLNPDYGTEADFKHLLDEAHKRHIKIIMDFVINHTSNMHPWFQSAINSPDSPYRSFYRIVSPKDSSDYDPTAVSPWNSSVWHPLGDLAYYGIFSENMPDLNYNEPKVREAIKSAAAKWLNLGVDGFRLDAALHIYGAHEFEGMNSLKGNLQWWNEFALACEKINPNVYLTGEAWNNDDPLSDYVQPFDTKFNFTLQSDMNYAVKNGLAFTSHGEDLAKSIETLLNTYYAVDPNYLDGIFASNHDQDRVMSSVGVETKARVIPHIYLTLPGNPFIYYGEELGMKGTKPDELIRQDFKWHDDDEALPNCNWMLRQNGQDHHMDNKDTPSLDSQLQDPNSMYNLYKNLISLRKNHEALMSGDYKALTTNLTSILGYTRSSKKESLIVLHNLSSKESQIELPELQNTILIYTSSSDLSPKLNSPCNGSITLPPYTSVIFQK